MQGMRSADAPVVGGEKMRPPVEYTRLGMRLLELYFANNHDHRVLMFGVLMGELMC